MFETGIKVIDVMCPLVAAGTVAFAGEHKTGVVVVSEETLRRVAGAGMAMSFFVLAPPPPGDQSTDWLSAAELKQGRLQRRDGRCRADILPAMR